MKMCHWSVVPLDHEALKLSLKCCLFLFTFWFIKRLCKSEEVKAEQKVLIESKLKSEKAIFRFIHDNKSDIESKQKAKSECEENLLTHDQSLFFPCLSLSHTHSHTANVNLDQWKRYLK